MGGELHIVGLGPAGVGAAIAASKMGLKPVIYESMPKAGVKPCGRGVPEVGDLPGRIPKDSIMSEVKGVIMYVDGEHLFEMRGFLEGYIVDKGRMLEAMAVEAGAEIVYRAKYDHKTGEVKLPGQGRVRLERGVFAGGHPYYSGDKILAIQWVMRGKPETPEGMLEIHFDTTIMGYLYVFPKDDKAFEVGIGGFSSRSRLLARLEEFIKSREDLRRMEKLRLEGAKIGLGGLRIGRLNGLVKAGESAGFVLPLTGEGIRPSMISGFEAARAMIEGSDPIKSMERSSMGRAVETQKRILDLVMKLTVEKRRELLKSLTPKAHAEIALGRLRKAVLALELAKSPRAASILLQAL